MIGTDDVAELRSSSSGSSSSSILGLDDATKAAIVCLLESEYRVEEKLAAEDVQRQLKIRHVTICLAQMAGRPIIVERGGGGGGGQDHFEVSFSPMHERQFARMQIFCNMYLKAKGRVMLPLLHLTPIMFVDAYAQSSCSSNPEDSHNLSPRTSSSNCSSKNGNSNINSNSNSSSNNVSKNQTIRSKSNIKHATKSIKSRNLKNGGVEVKLDLNLTTSKRAGVISLDYLDKVKKLIAASDSDSGLVPVHVLIEDESGERDIAKYNEKSVDYEDENSGCIILGEDKDSNDNKATEKVEFQDDVEEEEDEEIDSNNGVGSKNFVLDEAHNLNNSAASEDSDWLEVKSRRHAPLTPLSSSPSPLTPLSTSGLLKPPAKSDLSRVSGNFDDNYHNDVFNAKSKTKTDDSSHSKSSNKNKCNIISNSSKSSENRKKYISNIVSISSKSSNNCGRSNSRRNFLTSNSSTGQDSPAPEGILHSNAKRSTLSVAMSSTSTSSPSGGSGGSSSSLNSSSVWGKSVTAPPPPPPPPLLLVLEGNDEVVTASAASTGDSFTSKMSLISVGDSSLSSNAQLEASAAVAVARRGRDDSALLLFQELSSSVTHTTTTSVSPGDAKLQIQSILQFIQNEVTLSPSDTSYLTSKLSLYNNLISDYTKSQNPSNGTPSRIDNSADYATLFLLPIILDILRLYEKEIHRQQEDKYDTVQNLKLKYYILEENFEREKELRMKSKNS